ncbi:MAG: DUF2189 domain-containing protein [Roseivivax sp.]|nr:DUF2189 domain-containing protein [Roseivivax sp.]
MQKTIGNPLSWGAQALAGTGRTAAEVADTLGSHDRRIPRIREIGLDDIREALSRGIDDLGHFRSDVLILAVVYPVIGLALAYIAFNRGLAHLLFPLMSGFAILGPVAAVGLYELSRRREAGQPAGWGDAFAVLRPGVAGPVMVLGLFLLALFALWMFAAFAIYGMTMGPAAPEGLMPLIRDVMTTREGSMLIVLGCGVGFVFAATALVVSMTAFPMLIDRRAGLPVAVVTSVRVARKNPVAVAAWGLVVAVSLAVASLPMLLGLILVLPVLGHATWHLYRATVAWDDGR